MAKGIKPVNGLTSDTYNRLALDAGAVWIDYGLPGARLLGATRGGNTFTIEPEYREMPVDGAPGAVKGSQRIIREAVKLTVNMLEVKTDNILAHLPASESSVDGASHDKIIRCEQIAANAYIDNVTLLLNKNGTDEVLAFELSNALNLSPYELGATEDDEGVVTMEFVGHFDPADLTTAPWAVYNPLEGGVVRYALTYTAGANGQIIGDASQSVVATQDGEPVFAAADAGYVFTDWSDLSTDNPRTDGAVAADVTVTANFTTV